MKKVKVQDAIGLTLCHDMTEMKDGFKGAAFKRGHVVTEEDVAHLLEMGKEHVFIWEDNAGEVHEEDCAKRFVAACPVEGAHFEGPSEGKVLLFADKPGMYVVNRSLLNEINSIGDITVATIPSHYPVKPGDKLASMRIVPLVTKEEQIETMERMLSRNTLLRVFPYKEMKAGIIVTGSEFYHNRKTDKFAPVATAKLNEYPCTVLGTKICNDDADMITEAIKDFIAQGADLILCSGGMSVDPDDVTPTAIKAAGADIVTYGMPSQPGNMSLVSYLGDVTILGVPGAAVALPRTVFDALLPQVFTGLHFTKEELYSLAEGGLCQSCKVCHWPNCTFGRY